MSAQEDHSEEEEADTTEEDISHSKLLIKKSCYQPFAENSDSTRP